MSETTTTRITLQHEFASLSQSLSVSRTFSILNEFHLLYIAQNSIHFVGGERMKSITYFHNFLSLSFSFFFHSTFSFSDSVRFYVK